MSTTSAHDEATKFADDFVSLHAALALARASNAEVEKKTEAKNFYTVHWDTFEKGPIDTDEVLKQLEADIKDKEAAFAVAQQGLEGALGRMHHGEQILWWKRCKRYFSSVEPLKEYEPVVETPVIEEDGEEGFAGEDAAEDNALIGAAEEDAIEAGTEGETVDEG